MMKRPILEIDLDAIEKNYQLCQKQAKKSEIGAVVKANAYGLGSIEISKKLASLGCRTFFTAYYEEAIELLEHLPKTIKILIFNGIQGEPHPQLIPVINHQNDIPQNSPYWLHIDTGINRLGISPNNFRTELVQDNCLGIMSHLACADDKNHPKTIRQYETFERLVISFPQLQKSLCASSGLFNTKYHYDLIRPGLCLYGGNPNPTGENPMHSVITLSASILQKKILKKGETVGYGETYIADKDMQIGTIGLGYADGLFRYLSNKGHFKHKDKILKILGSVSMDLCVVDLSNLNESEFNAITKLEIIHKSYTIDDMAKEAGTISYEILTNLGHRFERIYTSRGR